MPQISPTEEERLGLSTWLTQPGNNVARLSRPERFLWGLGAVPRIRVKLAILAFRGQCPTLLQDAQEALATIRMACEQVKAAALAHRFPLPSP